MAGCSYFNVVVLDWRCFCRICAVLVLLPIILLICPCVAADQWPGWRGLENEGRSQYSEGPIHWSPDRNISWKNEIPGEGHSSPIVSQDAVYLTTAYTSKKGAHLKLMSNYIQFLMILLLTVLTIWFIVRCCSNSSNRAIGLRPLIRLTILALTVVMLCAFVLFAEKFFNFERCSIRQWITASIFVSISLILCAFYTSSQSRLRLVLGISLLIFAVFVAICVPAKVHAYRGGFRSPNRVVMLAVAGLPGLAGMILLSLCLPGPGGRRRDQARETARAYSYLAPILKWSAIVSAALVLLLVLIQVVFRRPETGAIHTLGNISYRPALKWWVVSIFTGVFTIFLIIRLAAGNSFLPNLGIVISAVPFCLISVAALLEQVIARSFILSYHLGTPKLDPILGWQAVGFFVVVCSLCLIASVITETHRHGAKERRLAAGLRIMMILMAIIYFASVNYLGTRMTFVRAIVSVDRNSGITRWICEGLSGPSGQLNRDNSAATPTPVTDGKRVYAYFGTVGLLCTDLRGRVLWTYKELPYETAYGVAISPILHDDSVIVLGESKISAYIAALDCRTGNLLWKTDRHKKGRPVVGNSRTPLIKEIKGRKVIVVWGYMDVSGYDPLTGQEVWSHDIEHVGGDHVASMVSDSDRLYLVGLQKILALEIDKLDSHDNPLVWQKKVSGGPHCSSPIIRNGLLFTVSDGGLIHCLDGESGQILWRKRLRGKHYPSLVCIGDRIYFCNTSGFTTVVACDKTYRKIAENDLNEQTYASFAAVDGELFIRTKNHLYCVYEGVQS